MKTDRFEVIYDKKALPMKVRQANRVAKGAKESEMPHLIVGEIKKEFPTSKIAVAGGGVKISGLKSEGSVEHFKGVISNTFKKKVMPKLVEG